MSQSGVSSGSSSAAAGGGGVGVSGVSSSSSLEALEGFALLCKSSTGLQCVMVLKQVLKHPSIFVFGELFHIPSIKELERSEHKPWYDLLKLFAYGTYMDYKQSMGLPELGIVEITKLKQLTIVNMANTQRHLPYSLLQSCLDLPNLRSLEDLIIDCINLGLIEGHLNQKDASLEILSAMGRDIGPRDVETMIQQLANWLHSTDSVLSTLRDQIVRVENEESLRKANELEHEDKKSRLIDTVKLNKLALGGGGVGMVSPTSGDAKTRKLTSKSAIGIMGKR